MTASFPDSRMRLRSCKAVTYGCRHPAVRCTYLDADCSKKSEGVNQAFYVADVTLLLYLKRGTNNRAALVLTAARESREPRLLAELDLTQ